MLAYIIIHNGYGEIIIKLKRLLLSSVVSIAALFTSGCVTQQFVMGSDNEVKERVINTREAAMARLKLALEYLQSGKTEQAKLNLDRALQIDDELDGVHASFAYFYQQVGEYEKADKSYRDALSQFPNNANTRNNYGAFLCGQKDFDGANAQFLKAIETTENTAMANSYENAGLCALRDENWPRAIEHLTKVLGYEGNRARSILGLSKAHLHSKDIDTATKYLRNYRQRFAQTPQSLWLAIQIEQKLNNHALAEKLGQILKRNYPKSAETKLYMAKTI